MYLHWLSMASRPRNFFFLPFTTSNFFFPLSKQTFIDAGWRINDHHYGYKNSRTISTPKSVLHILFDKITIMAVRAFEFVFDAKGPRVPIVVRSILQTLFYLLLDKFIDYVWIISHWSLLERKKKYFPIKVYFRIMDR